MRVCSIVGTRPQFLKLAALDSYIQKNKPFEHFIVHSGQHFDRNMSTVFFEQLNMTQPITTIDRNNSSAVRGLTHVMHDFERCIVNHNIDVVIVYGDCDTTLAGALVANKLRKKLVHVEAGLRGHNKKMPEEVNRTLTDHISDIFFCPDSHTLHNLNNERIYNNIRVVGNLQIELLNNMIKESEVKPLFPANYSLLTIHRDYNTNKKTIEKFFQELGLIDQRFVFPVHPRTRNIIDQHSVRVPGNIELIDPIGYDEMIRALLYSDYVITDSGGVQLESWFLGKKCIVMRTETEWIEPIRTGNSILYDHTTPLNKFVQVFIEKPIIEDYNLPLNTSELICNNILQLL